MADIQYEIIREYGVLSESDRGWKKELNLISWNGREAKYDLREWAPDRSHMGKGVTLTAEELQKLKRLLEGLSEEWGAERIRPGMEEGNQPDQIEWTQSHM